MRTSRCRPRCPGTSVSRESPTRIRDLDYTPSRLRQRPGLECPDARRERATDGSLPGSCGPPSRVDVAALFQALRDEVRRSGADPGRRTATLPTGAPPATRPSACGPSRPTARCGCVPACAAALGTPVKAVLRKLMRWYVEPLAYDQRSFNAAALRLIDDLQEQVDRLEAEVAALRDAKR